MLSPVFCHSLMLLQGEHPNKSSRRSVILSIRLLVCCCLVNGVREAGPWISLPSHSKWR